MVRKMIPFAIAITLVVGCGKKKKDDDSSDEGSGGDPNAAYTIKIRGAQQGDKVEVTVSETKTETEGSAVKGQTEKGTNKKRYEYTEQIIDMPAGAKRPNRLIRNYKVARIPDSKSNDLKALAFEGKTVNIENRFGYEYTVDGKKLDIADAFVLNLDGDLRDTDKIDLDAIRSKKPVKVGEFWTLDAVALKAALGGLGGALGFLGDIPGLDADKSKFTCRLTKAYTIEGKQWGTIAFDIDLVFETRVAPESMEIYHGTVKIEGTFDGVVDGSAREFALKGTFKGSFNGTDNGQPVNHTLEGSREKSVTPVK
jgi:hypothetical protein